MLKIDMTGLSDKELENAVTRHCTAWGGVAIVLWQDQPGNSHVEQGAGSG